MIIITTSVCCLSLGLFLDNMYDLIPFTYPLQNVKFIVREIELNEKSNSAIINPYPQSITYLLGDFNKCGHLQKSRGSLLVAVKSYVGDFDQRLSIRQTWGKASHHQIVVVFMVGHQNYSQPLLQKEEQLYHDIVQGAFEDTYDNNIFKTLMTYKWIVEFCDSVDYILFVDDDYLVNVDNIVHAIRKQQSFTGVDVMYGYKLFWRSPIRNSAGKWYVTSGQYSNNYYPSYLAGGAILTSIDIVRKFNIAFPYVKHLYIDDAYLGVVAKLLDITLQHDTRFSLYYVSPRELVNLFCSHGYGSRGSLLSGWKELYLSSRYLQPG